MAAFRPLSTEPRQDFPPICLATQADHQSPRFHLHLQAIESMAGFAPFQAGCKPLPAKAQLVANRASLLKAQRTARYAQQRPVLAVAAEVDLAELEAQLLAAPTTAAVPALTRSRQAKWSACSCWTRYQPGQQTYVMQS